MPEFWVEENIRPLSTAGTVIDSLLIDDLEPIVNDLKQRDVLSWHFLREDSQWKGNQNIRHIRLRFEATDPVHQKRVRLSLKRKLDNLQHNNHILDHYVGNNGRPVRFYRDYYPGENYGYNEQVLNPRGWSLVKESLNVGSEIALLLINGRMNQIQLGADFNFGKISHLFPNQCRHYPFQPVGPLRIWPNHWWAYDFSNPN